MTISVLMGTTNSCFLNDFSIHRFHFGYNKYCTSIIHELVFFETTYMNVMPQYLFCNTHKNNLLQSLLMSLFITFYFIIIWTLEKAENHLQGDYDFLRSFSCSPTSRLFFLFFLSFFFVCVFFVENKLRKFIVYCFNSNHVVYVEERPIPGKSCSK